MTTDQVALMAHERFSANTEQLASSGLAICRPHRNFDCMHATSDVTPTPRDPSKGRPPKASPLSLRDGLFLRPTHRVGAAEVRKATERRALRWSTLLHADTLVCSPVRSLFGRASDIASGLAHPVPALFHLLFKVRRGPRLRCTPARGAERVRRAMHADARHRRLPLWHVVL